jgi:hypothetical protein
MSAPSSAIGRSRLFTTGPSGCWSLPLRRRCCWAGFPTRFMRTLNKMVQTSTASSVNWKDVLPGFLLNYRASPYSTTGVAPAKLLFNRNINTKIPELVKQPEMEWNKEAKAPDESRKKKIKVYANKRFKTQDANKHWRYSPSGES